MSGAPDVECREVSTLDEQRWVSMTVELGKRAIIIQVLSGRRSLNEPFTAPTLYLPIAGAMISRADWTTLREAADACFAAYAARWPT